MKNGFPNRKSRTGAVGIGALFFLILLFLSVIVGIMYGSQIGARYGTWLAVVGGVVGSILGVGFAIGVMFFAALVSWPFEALSEWWLPYPPPCENKSCPVSHYTVERLSEDFNRKNPGFSPIGWRCKKCGNLYAALHSGRWVHILPEGGLKPYLRHKPFGRWQFDHNTDFTPPVPISEEKFFSMGGMAILFIGILALFLTRYLKYEWVASLGIVGTVCGATLLLLVVISRISVKRKTVETNGNEKSEQTGEQSLSGKGNIPGWVFPWIMALMIGGTASLTLFFQGGLKEPVVRWMVAGCSALGFVGGAIAWGVLSLKERKIDRIGHVSFKIMGDTVKFFGLKLIALIPGVIAINVLIAPLPYQSLMERICVSLITGGLFLIGFFVDGLSFNQYRRNNFTGVNRRFRIIAFIGLIMTIIGFFAGIIF